MKKKFVVKSKILFNDIINNGSKISNKYYVITSLPNEFNYTRFGIAVGTKVGNAVTRNKIKRQVRTIIDNNLSLFNIYKDYVIICKKEILSIDYNRMQKEMCDLLNKGENHEK